LEKSAAWNNLREIHGFLPTINHDLSLEAVGQYNDVVEKLRIELQDNNLMHFRIPSNALQLTVIRPTGDDSIYSEPRMERLCPPKFFKHQLSGIWTYLERRMRAQMNPPDPPKPGQPRNYWAMSDEELELLAGEIHIPYIAAGADGRAYVDRRIIIDELMKRDQHMSGTAHSSNIVVHGDVTDSTFQQGSHNVAITNYNKADIQQIVEEVKGQIAKLNLPQQDADDVVADIATVEAQLTSSRPKHHIITASLKSVQHILEHATGAALAHEAFPHLLAFLHLHGAK
jgi:hypothetical protein